MRLFFILAGLCGSTFAASYTVTVGKGGSIFTPNTIVAAVGDTVTFYFYAGSHDVVQGSYSTPCQPPTAGGFSSGVQTVSTIPGSTAFQVTISDTQPIWFYCSQGNADKTHCGNGMVGVINPSSDGSQTLAGYAAAAKNVNGMSGSPQSASGGTLVQVGDLSLSSSAAVPVAGTTIGSATTAVMQSSATGASASGTATHALTSSSPTGTNLSSSSSTGPSQPTGSASSGSTGLSIGAIAGIGVGIGVAALIGIGMAVFFLIRRRHSREVAGNEISGAATYEMPQRGYREVTDQRDFKAWRGERT